MNLVELDRALRQLRLSGMAAVLATRVRHAQPEKMAPIDLVSALVTDELRRRQDRLLERRLPAPLTLRQVDPLIRQLTLYRDLIDHKTGDPL